MAKTKLLKVRTEFFCKYEYSGLHHFTIVSKEEPTRDDLYDLGIYSHRCHCEHDCCGHLRYGAPRVERRNKRNEWYVCQHWYRNV